MPNTVQTLRSPTAGNRPVGRAQGELFVNFADKAFGVIDAADVSLDLLPVRFFSADASYAIGDFVLEAGTLYRARVAVTPKAFDPADWDALALMSDLTTALGGYLPLTGGTLSGHLAGTSAAFTASGSFGGTVLAGASPSAVQMYFEPTLGAVFQNLTTGGYFHLDNSNQFMFGGPLAKFSGNLIAGPRASISMGSGNGTSYSTANGFVVESHVTTGNVTSMNRVGSNGTECNFYQNTAYSCGSITVSGQVSTAYNTTSDTRLKTDARSFDPGPIIDATEVYNFAWLETQTSDPGKRSYGVMAQEANEVFPDAVTYIDHEDWWGVDYSKYVPLLLQELKTLRARVAVLEGGAPARDVTVNTVNVQPRTRPRR